MTAANCVPFYEDLNRMLYTQHTASASWIVRPQAVNHVTTHL